MLRRPKIYKRPVTIGIGFLCKNNNMVLATDSQMTWPGYKQTGYEKIITVPFRSSHRATLLKAGDWEWANIFHEVLCERAAVTDVISDTTIRDIAETCLSEVRKKIQDAYYHASQPAGATADYLNSRPTKFILAYPTDHASRFYTMDLLGALPSRVFHKFAAIGSGAELASYILNQIDTTSLDIDAAFNIAFYAIESCIAHSEGCGGPARAIGFSKTGVRITNSELFSAQMSETIRLFNQRHMANLGDAINRALAPIREPPGAPKPSSEVPPVGP